MLLENNAYYCIGGEVFKMADVKSDLGIDFVKLDTMENPLNKLITGVHELTTCRVYVRFDKHEFTVKGTEYVITDTENGEVECIIASFDNMGYYASDGKLRKVFMV